VRIALDAVREAHPYTASGTIYKSARSDADATAIWERLLSLGQAELASAIQLLSVHDEGLMMYGARARMDSVDALRILERAFELRSFQDRGLVAWDAFLASNGAMAFREPARRYVTGIKPIRAWRVLANAKNPLLEAARLYIHQPVSFSEWLAQPEIQLDKPHALVRHLQRMLLEPETLRDIVEREGVDRVNAWIDDCFVESERVTCFRRYLSEIPSQKWSRDDAVILQIVRRFDVPARGRPFWDTVPDDIAAAFTNWLKDRSLTNLLGEGERVTFWREFLPWMTDVVESRGKEAVFLVFENWFAVQFKEMGHATRMFSRDYLSGMRQKKEGWLYTRVLKERRIGRYTQQGQVWQDSARMEVMRVMRLQGTMVPPKRWGAAK
jgi:hypothetical protein